MLLVMLKQIVNGKKIVGVLIILVILGVLVLEEDGVIMLLLLSVWI